MLLQALGSISYPLVNRNSSYSPETPNLGQIRRFLEPCHLEIWRMTLKNNRAPLLSIIKLDASLTFDLWPWPFAWTSLLSLVITPENFMMIRWWEHSQKGVTDRQTDGRTDGQTDWTIHRAAWSQLKIHNLICIYNRHMIVIIPLFLNYSKIMMFWPNHKF